ncbi:hypothetical protein AC481_02265 [miscellaneous Crenarchaeota group archaeon SMTZ-80]|nr:MAG: hypothetical protein AC481_02265 [miscellaneous Crenarchaeota group archaeon SMTZ-80]
MEEDPNQTIDDKHFRVAIFGSARIKKGDPNYNLVYTLAKMISGAGMDIVTGGGPGLMNAASEGHHAGRKDSEIHSIGLKINLPKEDKEASHLDIKKEFNRFSNRLDNFMKLSNAVVIAPGGVGTLLELFYTWQLMQVKHICNIPMILLGDMWLELVQWVKKYPLKNKLLNIEDVELLFLAKNCEEAFMIIKKTYEGYEKGDSNFCLNYNKYKI